MWQMQELDPGMKYSDSYDYNIQCSRNMSALY